MEVINILMVDDQKDVFESLKDRARKFRIILHHEEYLADAIERLRTDKKMLGVIIDGKGFTSKNQIRGDETSAFVGEMITKIAVLEDREGRSIPKVVLTAWYDELKETIPSHVRVFDKKRINEDEHALSEFFDHIRSEIKKAPEYKIRDTYRNIFEVVNRKEFEYSSESLDSRLLNLLSIYESRIFNYKDYYLIRSLLENIFIALKNLKVLNEGQFYSSGKPDHAACLKYIESNSKRIHDANLFPNHIYSCFNFVKYVHNELSHIDDNIPNTKYAFDACVSSCLEILIWINESFYSQDNYE
jgi:hypothetical protein